MSALSPEPPDVRRALAPRAAHARPGMLHPGFRDTAAPDGGGDDTAAGAFVLVAWLASFAMGAICQAYGGWPAALVVWSASAGAAAWAVRRAVRRGAGP